MLSEADSIRMKHMIDAAQEAIRFVEGQSRAELDDNMMLSFALVRAIEIIGEAAARVSKDGKSMCPELPWESIVAMRNRIIHAYFDIDLDMVWETVRTDLPELINKVRDALRQHGSEEA